MFEVPKFTEEECDVYQKVKFALYMSSIAQWAEERNRDLTQQEAEEMANELWEFAPENEFEYLDENYGEK